VCRSPVMMRMVTARDSLMSRFIVDRGLDS
jgi:hypothetical protein